MGDLIYSPSATGSVYRRWDRSVAVLQAAQRRAFPKPRLETRFIKSGSIVVPGMSGQSYTQQLSALDGLCSNSDSHVHMLEYGASRLIPLESANRPQGKSGMLLFHILAF